MAWNDLSKLFNLEFRKREKQDTGLTFPGINAPSWVARPMYKVSPSIPPSTALGGRAPPFTGTQLATPEPPRDVNKAATGAEGCVPKNYEGGLIQ